MTASSPGSTSPSTNPAGADAPAPPSRRVAVLGAGSWGTTLAKILAESGAELVLHGHNHETMFNALATQTGKAHIIGAPSASMAHGQKHESAAWLAYDIDRKKGQWHTVYRIRRWDEKTGAFRDDGEGELPHGGSEGSVND